MWNLSLWGMMWGDTVGNDGGHRARWCWSFFLKTCDGMMRQSKNHLWLNNIQKSKLPILHSAGMTYYSDSIKKMKSLINTGLYRTWPSLRGYFRTQRDKEQMRILSEPALDHDENNQCFVLWGKLFHHWFSRLLEKNTVFPNKVLEHVLWLANLQWQYQNLE